MGKAEEVVEGHLRRRVNALGGMCLKFSASIKNGVPDRIVILNGHTLFVETKAKRGKPSEIQLFRHKEMRKAGAEVHVIYTPEQVDALIEDIMARA